MPSIPAAAIGALIALATPSSPAPVPQPPTVARLVWLAGCWRQTTGTRVVDEQWMAPSGGMMLGIGRTVRDGRVAEWEQVRIHERDGGIVYSATPSGQTPADFTTATVSDTLVAFENPAHDFPQRVVYRTRGRDSLIARVEGTRNGQTRGVDFPYARVACR